MWAEEINMGRGKEGGETVQELQGRDPEPGATGWIGRGEDVEDLVGASADEVEALQELG